MNSYSLSIQILGVPFIITTCNTSHLQQISYRFQTCVYPEAKVAPVLVNVSRSRDRYLVKANGREEYLQLDGNWPRFEDLIQMLAEVARSDLVFVHGSCVASSSGAALLYGASTVGKSTLALSLRQFGYMLLADDTTPLRFVDSKAFPFPTAAGLRPFTKSVAERNTWEITASRLDETLFRVGVPVRWLVHVQPIRSTESSTIGIDAANWQKVRYLATGERATKIKLSKRYRFDSRSFETTPVLTRLRPIEGIRSLLQHTSMNNGNLADTLSEMSSLVDNAHFYEFRPGPIAANAEIISTLLSSAC